MKTLKIRERIAYKKLCETLGISTDEMTAQLVRNVLAMNQQFELDEDLEEFNDDTIIDEDVFDRIGNIVITKRNDVLYEDNKPITLSRYYDLVQGHQLAEEARMLIDNDKYEQTVQTLQRRKDRIKVEPQDLDGEWHSTVALNDTEKYDGKYLCYGELEINDHTVLKEAWYTVNRYADYKGNMIVNHASMNQVGYIIGQHLSDIFIGMTGSGVAWNGQEILEIELDETDDVPPSLFGKKMVISLKDDKVLWSKFKNIELKLLLDLHEQEDENQIIECHRDDTHKLHSAQQAMMS